MLFMKEMRAKVVAECTMKESAAINQILGRKWHALPREEQAKFYEMARKEKELHQRMYPGWSARDNYAYHAKRRKSRYRYRNFEGAQGVADGYQTKMPAKDGGSPLGGQGSNSNGSNGSGRSRPADGIYTTGPMDMPASGANSALYRSPFTIGHLPYTGGSANDNFYNSMDKGMAYFGIMDRQQQHAQQQQPCSFPMQHGDPNCGKFFLNITL